MGHTFSNNLLHLVFSTKDRVDLISDPPKVHNYIGGIVRKLDCQALTTGGTANHLHLLAKLRPDISVSDFIRTVKASSSKWISESGETRCGFQWQAGYSSFSVSESNAKKVIAYIERQAEHHRVVSFEEELAQLLLRHGIEFDRQHYLD